MSTVLLTGARAPVALELARLFHAAGHRVVVAESVEPHLCQGSRAVAASHFLPPPNRAPAAYVEALEGVMRHERVDLLLPTCEEVFWIAAGRDRLARHGAVLAPPLDRLRALHSKLRFIRDLEARGVEAPDTWAVDDRGLAFLWEALPAGTRLVFKPEFSRFAVEVQHATVGGPKPALDARRGWIAQRFVEGRQLCTWSFARAGVLRAHAAYDAAFTAGPGAAVSFVPLDHPKLEAWVRDFVRATAFTGQLAFDFIEDAQGRLWPLECNPRATSGVHLFGPDDGLVEVLLDAPGAPACARPRPDARAVLGLAMWLYALPAQRDLGGVAAWAERLAFARDAVFRWDDPRPALDQLAVFGGFWLAGQKAGVSAIAASTADIEWNGGPIP